MAAAAAAAEAERPHSARECYASDGKRTGLDLEHRVPGVAGRFMVREATLPAARPSLRAQVRGRANPEGEP